jgi:uncharacterized protein YndB with AHSA1/START domain
MLKIIGLLLLAAIVIVLGLAAFQPDDFRVERSATIQAPAAKIYPYLADFHQWPTWSPWEKLDPNMKRTFGGPESGVGATYAWEGNSDVGSGKMEIKEATEPSKVGIQLDFLEPMEATSTTELTLTPQGEGTQVQWAMSGKNNFVAKVMCVFVSMDKMVGKDFEKGLANLKAAAEG